MMLSLRIVMLENTWPTGENMLTRNDAYIHITMALQTMLNHRKDEIACEVKDKHFYLNDQSKLRKSKQKYYGKIEL